MSIPIIAIDGGAASGKSSTSRALSQKYHLLHVDTGSHYRALTATLLEQDISPDCSESIKKALKSIALSTLIEGNSAQMCINGKSLADPDLRTPKVNANVSKFAAIPEIRATLLTYQRHQATVAEENHFSGLIMEGRDIGSVIFPDAQFRYFLQASPEVRARRRALEGQQDSVAERDRQDSSRQTAPLQIAPGAILIDSTCLTLEQVVEKISLQIAPILMGK